MKASVYLWIYVFCLGLSLASRAISATVPFVGCVGGGVSSPATPPTGKPVYVDLPSTVAEKLAFYGAEGTGVLAPRGWKCLGEDSNDSKSLFVFPQTGRLDSGPLVAIAEIGNDSNGNAVITDAYICQYFNSQAKQARICLDAQKSNQIPESQRITLPFYPDDELSFVNDYMIKYFTPSGALGLGSSVKNDLSLDAVNITPKVAADLPTKGFLVVGSINNGKYEVDGVTIFVVRLYSNLNYLENNILDFEKNCILRGNHAICSNEDTYKDGEP